MEPCRCLPQELRQRAEDGSPTIPIPRRRPSCARCWPSPTSSQTDLADRFARDAAVRDGGAARRARRGAEPDEPRGRRAGDVGAGAAGAGERARAAQRGVIVGADARRMSRELSEDVAAILAAAGLRVVLFPNPVPTPLVGFAVKKPRRRRGRRRDREPQPARVQRLQGLLGERGADRPSGRRAHRRRHRARPRGQQGAAPDLEDVMRQGMVTEASIGARAPVPGGRTRSRGAPGPGRPVDEASSTRPCTAWATRCCAARSTECGFTPSRAFPSSRSPTARFPPSHSRTPRRRARWTCRSPSRADWGAAGARERSGRRPARGGGAGGRGRTNGLPAAHGQRGGGAARALPAHRATREAGRPARGRSSRRIVSSPLLGLIAASLGVSTRRR